MEKQIKLLIVDDEEAVRYGMRRALVPLNFTILEAANVAEARAQLKNARCDLMLLDVNMPGESGLDFLPEVRALERAPLVVVVTAHGSERTAALAIKSGAYDYLAKPFEIDELRLIVKNAVETINLRRENRLLHDRIETQENNQSSLIGASQKLERVRSMINKVAETDATVLIYGESGTGKELVAREIHERGMKTRPGAFVAVNCAALPSELIESELFGHEKGAFTGAAARRRGKFEQADGGTLFLDEIGDMSINVQAKLLRALEEKSIERLGGSETLDVDARIISATHRDLESEIATGKFRADLFYRLRVVTIEVPPLRDRREDIPTLAELFLQRAVTRYGLTPRRIAPTALDALMRYDFPGNIRELRNLIERAAILADEDEELTHFDLPTRITHHAGNTNQNDLTGDAPELNIAPGAESDEAFSTNTDTDSLDVPFTNNFREDRREFERRYIIRCLDDADGNVTRAASKLGMHRQSLQHKLRELNLSRRYIAVENADQTASVDDTEADSF
ncbi:MAG: sigma-54 dependent transcriptional regulator [Pyrinomonadaceae bacterium MAG19_C2-C3]|nr:sigma-54 dependent transcriptional regulator [Pyrinomonadaceae bacterium MAG19_C2-C3]